jgi:hypothetical protein
MANIEGKSVVFERRLRLSMGAALAEVRFREGGHLFTVTLEFPRRPEGPPEVAISVGRLLVSALACDGRASEPVANVIAARALRFTDLLTPHLGPLLEKSDLQLTINLGDGGVRGALSFDRPYGEGSQLFPDLYLLRARAPPSDPSWGEFRSEFMARKPVLFWRGSTTGGGNITSRRALWNIPRVRACRVLAQLPRGVVDCKISRIVRADGFDLRRAALEMRIRRIMGPPVPEETFREYQMTIDLPGNSAAWGACLKYLGGCLVLRPPQTHELIYSAQLKPWIHFIPVSPDFVDVEERIAWVTTHQEEAAAIAWQGLRLLSSTVRSIPATVADIAERQRLSGERNDHHHRQPAPRDESAVP